MRINSVSHAGVAGRPLTRPSATLSRRERRCLERSRRVPSFSPREKWCRAAADEGRSSPDPHPAFGHPTGEGETRPLRPPEKCSRVMASFFGNRRKEHALGFALATAVFGSPAVSRARDRRGDCLARGGRGDRGDVSVRGSGGPGTPCASEMSKLRGSVSRRASSVGGSSAIGRNSVEGRPSSIGRASQVGTDRRRTFRAQAYRPSRVVASGVSRTFRSERRESNARSSVGDRRGLDRTARSRRIRDRDALRRPDSRSDRARSA